MNAFEVKDPNLKYVQNSMAPLSILFYWIGEKKYVHISGSDPLIVNKDNLHFERDLMALLQYK